MEIEFVKVVEYVEKKSRFFGYLLPCEKVEEVENALKILWKEASILLTLSNSLVINKSRM